MIHGYFITGENPSTYNSKLPKWITDSERAFDFTSTAEEDRKASFNYLLSTTVTPFTELERQAANFQYNILLQRMSEMINADQSQSSLKSLMNRICTTPKLYSDIPLAITVMLFSVCAANSECGIESLISSISRSNSKSRPLSLSLLNAEINIKENGPAPLSKSCKGFLYDSLSRHFGGGPTKWTFCHGSSLNCPASSVVINRLLREAPESKL